MNISELLASGLYLLGRAWWVEVLTAVPKCTYYFGPFANAHEAALAVVGYVEDLEGESAQGIQTHVRRLKPSQLTIDDEYDNLGAGIQ
ncbi:DUF1816 domain-containing protein [Chamaesiphon sp.]|uniref:DUF1816 domain-containing protein n=1 Tax=Chamaesiphon sp. TaxID=2814140 RepID=UPI003593F465